MSGITSQLDHVIRNGDAEQTYDGLLHCANSLQLATVVCVGCVNLSFAYVEGESLLMAMKSVALSSGRQVGGLPSHSHYYPLLMY